MLIVGGSFGMFRKRAARATKLLDEKNILFMIYIVDQKL